MSGCLLLLSLGLPSCGSKIDPVEAFVAALDETNEEGRQATISEYISHHAEYYVDFPLYIVGFDCTGESAAVQSSQALVTSPVEVEGNVVYVHADQQFWDIGVSCENDEFHYNGFSGTMEKVFNEDGVTGTAIFEGEAYSGKKRERCDVDFTLTFDLETGTGISAEGTLCDEPASDHAARITVPGFANEHRLDYLP